MLYRNKFLVWFSVQQNAEIQAHYQVYTTIVKGLKVENATAEHTTGEKTVCEL